MYNNTKRLATSERLLIRTNDVHKFAPYNIPTQHRNFGNEFSDEIMMMSATYYVFNIVYPEELGASLEFIQRSVYFIPINLCINCDPHCVSLEI